MSTIERLKQEARRHQASGRREQAADCYERICELQREAGHAVDPDLHLSLGDLRYRQGDEAAALREYQRAADRYTAMGSRQNAESLHNLCSRLFPDRPEPHLKLAELYFRVGHVDKAHQEVQQIARAASEAAEDGGVAEAIRRYVTAGERDLFAGRVIDALRDQPSVRALISTDADSADARATDADAAGHAPPSSSDSIDGADGWSLDEMPEWLSSEAFGEGATGKAVRELERGLEVLEEMLEVDPERVDLLQRRAVYARKLGHRDRLIRAWLDLADAIRAERGSRGARLLYHRVLELDPTNERALEALRPVDRAAVRAAAAGTNEATAAAGESLERVDHGDFERRILREFSDESDPLRWLEAAAESTIAAGADEKDRPLEFYEFFGRYLLARGRSEAAATVLAKGLSHHRRSTTEEEQAECRFALGLALRQSGRAEEAREHFRQLAQLDPAFRVAWETIPDPGAEVGA